MIVTEDISFVHSQLSHAEIERIISHVRLKDEPAVAVALAALPWVSSDEKGKFLGEIRRFAAEELTAETLVAVLRNFGITTTTNTTEYIEATTNHRQPVRVIAQRGETVVIGGRIQRLWEVKVFSRFGESSPFIGLTIYHRRPLEAILNPLLYFATSSEQWG